MKLGVNKLHRITRKLSCELIIRVKKHSSAVHMDAYVSACLDPDYECFFAAVPPVHSLAQIASFIFSLLYFCFRTHRKSVCSLYVFFLDSTI